MNKWTITFSYGNTRLNKFYAKANTAEEAAVVFQKYCEKFDFAKNWVLEWVSPYLEPVFYSMVDIEN